jgi:uncharacterized protein (TIGR03083 family)
MDSTTIRQAIRDLDSVFLADMRALPTGDWQRPSDCDGWTIAAAFIHIVQVAELLGDSLARGRAGDPGPPPLAAAEGVQAWRAARTARQQAALTKPPSELFAWYDDATGPLNAELDRIASAPPDAQGWHPIGPRPVTWIQDQWLFELALHDWDIRVAFDPAADVRPEFQAPFGHTLPDRLGRGFSGADDPDLAGTYRVELGGEPPHTFDIKVGNGEFSAALADTSTPDATIHTDPSAFGLVTSNRRPVDRFSAAGRWHLSGETASASAFVRAFKSY